MTPQEALNLLDQARQAIQANWETHQHLAMAVAVLGEAITPKEE